MSDFCVLIPAYKPGSDLIKLLNEIVASTLCDIVVVDDGSGVEYKHIFDEVQRIDRCSLISYENNKGKGHALKKGFGYCFRKYGKSINGVVTADADGQHLLKDIVRVGETLKNNNDKLVLGVRCFSNSIPLRSKFGNNITIGVYRLASGIKVSDTQTGLRGIPSEYLQKMTELEGERYEYEMNMLLSLKDMGLDVCEIPIETVYIDDNSGSHFNAVKDSVRIYKLIFKKSYALKFMLSSVVAFLVDWSMYSIILGYAAKTSVFTSLVESLNSFLRIFSSMNMTVFASQIIARIISSITNFYINKKYVFANKDHSIDKNFLQGVGYFLLVVFNLVIIAGPVNKMLIGWGVNKYISQPIANIIQFMISYLVQKLIIFRKKQ